MHYLLHICSHNIWQIGLSAQIGTCRRLSDGWAADNNIGIISKCVFAQWHRQIFWQGWHWSAGLSLSPQTVTVTVFYWFLFWLIPWWTLRWEMATHCDGNTAEHSILWEICKHNHNSITIRPIQQIQHLTVDTPWNRDYTNLKCY